MTENTDFRAAIDASGIFELAWKTADVLAHEKNAYRSGNLREYHSQEAIVPTKYVGEEKKEGDESNLPRNHDCGEDQPEQSFVTPKLEFCKRVACHSVEKNAESCHCERNEESILEPEDESASEDGALPIRSIGVCGSSCDVPPGSNNGSVHWRGRKFIARHSCDIEKPGPCFGGMKILRCEITREPASSFVPLPEKSDIKCGESSPHGHSRLELRLRRECAEDHPYHWDKQHECRDGENGVGNETRKLFGYAEEVCWQSEFHRSYASFPVPL